MAKAERANLSFEEAKALGEVEVERRLFKTPEKNRPAQRVPIDFEWVHRELRRVGVTLQLLWGEYLEHAARDPEQRKPYQYSQFCDLYRAYKKRVNVSMRQVHKGGEKCFVDYSGKRPSYFDRDTGEKVEVELFVATMGASNYTFAEATRSQKLEDFCASTSRAFEYFGGVPEILVPDRLRSAVTGNDRIDPDINPTYAELAAYYGTAIIPARSRKPKDKAKVENSVLVAQRWVLARIRNIVFTSLEDLNAAIAGLVEEMNARPFQKMDGCRRSVFEELDAPALKPLPVKRFEVADWKKAKVNIDYHVEYDARLYSVPHRLVGSRVELRVTSSVVEAFFNGRRITSHRRSYGRKGTATTLPEHRPKSHREYGDWPPSRLVNWAAEIGPSVALVVTAILESRPHPEMGYRSCQALIRDAKKYGRERTEKACARALDIGNPTRKTVTSLLKRGLESSPELEAHPEPEIVAHENVRGGDYYDREGQST